MDAFFVQIALIFFLFCTMRSLFFIFFHNGTFTTDPTSEFSNSSNSSYSTAHLLLPCCQFSWSRDLSNPFCDLMTVKPLLDTTLWWLSAQETWCAALVYRCVCFSFCGGLLVLLVILLFHSITRFKWVARQTLTMVFPFKSFWKRYRPAVKFSQEYTVYPDTRRPLSPLKMGAKQ